MRGVFESPGQLSGLGAATAHRTVGPAARPMAASASSAGQTGHAGRVTAAGKNSPDDTKPRWTDNGKERCVKGKEKEAMWETRRSCE
ncbi:hypothetical protein VZT92_016028 [Zoarces viviparus]|uniref:Uncharacterized protein n=1 Tax=Zoarces viviparus TaxID=48416 RepID=A0AAW1ERC1_ZOAVI